MALAFPLVNGVRMEWSSVEIKLGGDIFLGVASIDYTEKLDPTMVYGTHPQPIGRTRGQYLAEGKIELYKSEALQLREKLGAGYLETPFDVVVQYAEPGQDVVTDELIGARLKGLESSHSSGTDPLKESSDLSIMFIRRNGVQGLLNPLAAPQA
jgi:hypothetical protein